MQLKKPATLATAIAVALGTLAILPQSALALTDINACTTITAPGSYRVTKNLTANGDCIVINTSFVTIDLGGHVLTGNGSGDGIRALLSPSSTVIHQGIEVRNGTVTNFRTGIGLIGSNNAVVERIRAINNKSVGIAVGQGSIVRWNIASGNERGIFASKSLLVENSVYLNLGTGVNVVNCPSQAIGNLIFENDQLQVGRSNLSIPTTGCTSIFNNAP